MALNKAVQIGWLHFGDTSGVNMAVGNLFVFYQLTQPRGGVGVEFVVVMGRVVHFVPFPRSTLSSLSPMTMSSDTARPLTQP